MNLLSPFRSFPGLFHMALDICGFEEAGIVDHTFVMHQTGVIKAADHLCHLEQSLAAKRFVAQRPDQNLSLIHIFADNMAQYLVPQECGAKTAVRWAKVVDRKGRGLLFTADAAKPMFFSALPYTPHEMESAKHPYELPPVHYTVIRAIGEQMGVGGDDSWGANVHPEYIPDVTKPVEFTFTFRGI